MVCNKNSAKECSAGLWIFNKAPDARVIAPFLKGCWLNVHNMTSRNRVISISKWCYFFWLLLESLLRRNFPEDSWADDEHFSMVLSNFIPGAPPRPLAVESTSVSLLSHLKFLSSLLLYSLLCWGKACLSCMPTVYSGRRQPTFNEVVSPLMAVGVIVVIKLA